MWRVSRLILRSWMLPRRHLRSFRLTSSLRSTWSLLRSTLWPQSMAHPVLHKWYYPSNFLTVRICNPPARSPTTNFPAVTNSPSSKYLRFLLFAASLSSLLITSKQVIGLGADHCPTWVDPWNIWMQVFLTLILTFEYICNSFSWPPSASEAAEAKV